MKNYIRLPRLY